MAASVAPRKRVRSAGAAAVHVTVPDIDAARDCQALRSDIARTRGDPALAAALASCFVRVCISPAVYGLATVRSVVLDNFCEPPLPHITVHAPHGDGVGLRGLVFPLSAISDSPFTDAEYDGWLSQWASLLLMDAGAVHVRAAGLTALRADKVIEHASDDSATDVSVASFD
jgi:hypothetical protein